jgi:DNA mismatch repair protein MutS
MSFTADKQTLEDLNVPGKYKPLSIFSLFNKVITAGGERLLQTMFQTPMTEPNDINKRSEIFQYFQSKQTTFPFSNEQFGQVENYLNGSSNNYYPATLFSLAKKKLLATIIRDEEYPNLQSGLQQTVALLKSCKVFISQLEEEQKSKKEQHPFSNELRTAKKILDDPKPLYNPYKKQPNTTIC